MPTMSNGTFICAFLFATGCAASAQRPAAIHSHDGAHAHTHAHDHAAPTSGSPRDAMFPTLAGDRLVMLTAHLSGAGHELDIFFEGRGDRSPSPIADRPIQATVYTRTGERTVTFECAPAAERPAGEAQGTCSHFIAKTPWLAADETIKIAGTLADGAGMRWQGFKAAKYAHHDDRRVAGR